MSSSRKEEGQGMTQQLSKEEIVKGIHIIRESDILDRTTGTESEVNKILDFCDEVLCKLADGYNLYKPDNTKNIQVTNDNRDTDQGFSNLYEIIRDVPDNFSKWYDKIKDCGINVPESTIIQVPEYVVKAMFMKNHVRDTEIIAGWVKNEVMPKVPDGLLFMKNGLFSDKFDFQNCLVNKDFYEIVHKMININYAALCVGCDGQSEIVFRKRIREPEDHNAYKIYNGMPLRPEFRVFYDFNNRKVLYSVNYWDWDYCHEAISRDKSDKLSFEAAYPGIEKFFNEHQKEVEELVNTHMKDVDLAGIWSVDIMSANDTYYLIDMARAENSAYWKG